MIVIPNEVFTRYQAHLTLRGCPEDRFSEYKKGYDSMIYTHGVPVWTAKEPEGPLDF